MSVFVACDHKKFKNSKMIFLLFQRFLECLLFILWNHVLWWYPWSVYRVRKVKDRTVVVTGAASGIGNAIAILLAKSGWTVIACDIDVAKLVQLNQVPNISTIHLDVRSKSSTELLRKHVDRRFPRGLDAVVREISVCINLSLSLSLSHQPIPISNR
ncbi:SDR family oxidoreductase [bacterium]|nr:SDR family oxidoreductase [bacterium]